MSPHLLQLRCTLPSRSGAQAYPFTVPAVRALADRRDGLALDAPVVCFVGENGSGKSTLLEGLAAAVGPPAVGSTDVAFDPTLAPARALARQLKLVWRTRTTRGFFLRAEDFFGFAKRLTQLRAELEARTAEVREEYRAQDRWGSRSGRCAARAPLLLAYPGARLYSFDASPPASVEWEALEHVRLTRDFLAASERFLRHL